MYLSRVSGCRLLTILRFRTLKFLQAKELGRRFSLPSISIPVISRTSSPGQLSAMFIIRLNDKFRNVSWSSTRLEYFWMNSLGLITDHQQKTLTENQFSDMCNALSVNVIGPNISLNSSRFVIKPVWLRAEIRCRGYLLIPSEAVWCLGSGWDVCSLHPRCRSGVKKAWGRLLSTLEQSLGVAQTRNTHSTDPGIVKNTVYFYWTFFNQSWDLGIHSSLFNGEFQNFF